MKLISILSATTLTTSAPALAQPSHLEVLENKYNHDTNFRRSIMNFFRLIFAMFISTIFSVPVMADESSISVVESYATLVDPRFTFEAASKAFANAGQPSVNELLGAWLLIGRVASPGDSVLYLLDGYFPDGLFPINESLFHTKNILDIEAVTNAFDQTQTIAMISISEAETGRFLGKTQLEPLSYIGGQAEFFEPGHSTACSAILSCRIVSANNLLLCSERNSDISRQCYGSLNRVGMFYGYRKIY